VNKVFKIRKEKFETKCYFGISTQAHEARIVTLLNNYLDINLSLLETKEKHTIFRCETEFTQVVLLKNMDYNVIYNPKLRGIKYVLFVFSDDEEICSEFLGGIRKMAAENDDIIYANKIFEKDIEKRYRASLINFL